MVLLQFRKIMVEPLIAHGLFYQYPYYVYGSGNISVVLLSIHGQKYLWFHQKHVICDPKMNEGITGLERNEGE